MIFFTIARCFGLFFFIFTVPKMDIYFSYDSLMSNVDQFVLNRI